MDDKQRGKKLSLANKSRVIGVRLFLFYTPNMQNQNIEEAYKKAKEVREQAHAPYSRFLVGACFKVKDQNKYVSGCNVENASFGATVCAERVAVWKWVSERVKTETLEFLVLVTDTQDPVATPCGMCLQVMSEFVPQDFPIYISNLKGVQKTVKFKDLLPQTFSLEMD